MEPACFLYVYSKRATAAAAPTAFWSILMSLSPANSNDNAASALKQFSTMFLIEGIVLVVLGLLAVAVPQVATVAVTIFLGWLFLISGVVGIATSFMARSAPGFWWALLSGAVAVAAGVVLIASPIQGALSLTVVLIALFLLQGIATVMYAVEHRRELSGRWGFMLFSGLITLALAVMIFAGLPATAGWALGLLVGIDMVFGGAALIAIATAAKRAA
jgi:uncharacterized membrane protein HdeD (DUF308 family)